jgi:hypothetical protein
MSTRNDVITAASCPFCGAERGEPCLGKERRDGRRRRRESCHAERWKAAGVDTRAERNRRRLEAAARAERERRDLEAMASLREERSRRRPEAAARVGR